MANQPAEARGEPVDGLWPSRKLLRSLLARRAEDVARQLDLNDSQRSAFRRSFVDRWDEFLTTRRDDVQPVLNEFLEMRMDIDPPSVEQVRSWAERCAPVFEDVRDEVSAGNDELRKLLTPTQRIRFEVEAAKWSVGLELAEQRIGKWSRGEGDPSELWQKPGERRRRGASDNPTPGDRDNPAQRRDGAADRTAETDPIGVELQRWDRWLAEFMDAHSMDAGQRDAARSALEETKQRAMAHRDRNRAEIDSLEEQIAGRSELPSDFDAIKRRLVELYGPIDNMFTELKNRVETLLTSEQRAAALKTDTNSRPGTTGQSLQPKPAAPAESKKSPSEPGSGSSGSDTTTNRPVESP